MADQYFNIYEREDFLDHFVCREKLHREYMQAYAPIRQIASDIPEVKKHPSFKRAKADAELYAHCTDVKNEIGMWLRGSPDLVAVELSLDGDKLQTAWKDFKGKTRKLLPNTFGGFQNHLEQEMRSSLGVSRPDRAFVRFDANPVVSTSSIYAVTNEVVFVVFTNPRDAAKAKIAGVLNELQPD